MAYVPLNYDKINLINGTYTPSQVKSVDNAAFNYWQRSLFQRAMSIITIENMPVRWHGSVKDFLWYCLFKYGYVSVFNDIRFGGECFQPCGLTGWDFYYQPTTAVISNPKLRIDLTIHKSCEILKLTPDYRGIWDIINRYSEKLATLDGAIDMAIINSKYAIVKGASTKAAAKFLEKVQDKINSGQPAIVFDTSVLVPKDPVTKEDAFVDLSRDNIKNTYIGGDLLMDFETILHEFDTEIGIPTLPYQKKERMITDEAQSKQVDATSRSLVWVDTMNECFNLINPFLKSSMRAVHNYADLVENTSGGENNE